MSNPCVLIVAYHYPPVGASSGVHRTLKFSQHLPDYGWKPLILTISPRAYERISEQQLADVPREAVIKRAFGLDTAKHLSIMGRYPDFAGYPDRWISWYPAAVVAGMRLISKWRPSVIMSTYPIATAHLIGLTLKKLSGLPWIADFRDSMTEENYPRDPRKRKIYQWIEKKAVQHSNKAVFTTPGALEMYKERYPQLDSRKWTLIENGYDEEAFARVEGTLQKAKNLDQKQLRLVHSGLLYPFERNPACLFVAVKELKQQGAIGSDKLRIILRASGNERNYGAVLKRMNIDDIVELAPPLGYDDALKEMVDADGLLILQGSSCNHQIPAKIYEYLRAKRPIIALTDPDGDTAGVLRRAGAGVIARLDNTDEIKDKLLSFLTSVEKDTANMPSESHIRENDRRTKAKLLASLLDNVEKK